MRTSNGECDRGEALLAPELARNTSEIMGEVPPSFLDVAPHSPHSPRQSTSFGTNSADVPEHQGAQQHAKRALWPWSIWAKIQKIGQRQNAAGEQAQGPTIGPGTNVVKREMAESRSSARLAVASNSAPESFPSSYKARWPSVWARVACFMRPVWDAYFVLAVIVLYATPKPNPDSPQAWRVVKDYNWAFIWIPFVYRFFTGFLHWVLSLVIMPGCILYMRGPAVRLLPKGLQETINENDSVRSKRRDELLIATSGIPVTLISPDGVELDAIYWAGQARNCEISYIYDVYTI